MAGHFAGRVVLCALAAIAIGGCGGQQSDVQRHAEKIDSLRASTVTLTNAWLAGDVSGTYTLTALERTFELVANEREAVASTPEDLTLPAAETAVRDSEALTRALGAIWDAVRRADASSARRQLAELSPSSSG